MTALLALTRKQLVESRWLLIISALALFLLMWMFVFGTNRIEQNGGRGRDEMTEVRIRMMARGFGGPSADGSSASLEIMWWRHPLIILVLAMWPIARGSAAVAGELEKGSLDLVLSRPISRSSFLTAQLLSASIGIAVLAAALVGGILWGNTRNWILTPPTFVQLVRPAINAMGFAFAILGFTTFLSAIDIVRWRPNLLASTLMLAMFIANVIANLSLTVPALESWKWLEKVTIFTLYDPVEAAIVGTRLGFNTAVLAANGLVGIALAYIAFNYRDLPTNS